VSTTNTSVTTSKRQVLDYTSRDYKSIRTMLVGLAKGYLPDWQTVGNTGDFGTLLLELYAYVGDVMNYYIDRVAAEAFLGTAVRRQSVLYIADMLGYRPMGQRAATVPVTFTWTWDTENLTNGQLPVYTYNVDTVKIDSGTVMLSITSLTNTLTVGQTVKVPTTIAAQLDPAAPTISGYRVLTSVVYTGDHVVATYDVDSTSSLDETNVSNITIESGNTVVIPKGTVVSSSPLADGSVVTFETDTAVVLDTQNGRQISDGSTTFSLSVQTTASEGTTINPYLIGTSKGIPNAEFVISNAGVIDRTVKIFTKEGGQVITWDSLDKISLATPTQSAFSTYVDDNNYTHVLFGDKTSGRIPPTNVEIYASYRYGVGAAANDLTINSIVSLNNDYANTLGITVTNSKAPAGGSDVESIDSMRYSIPRTTALNQRAVSLEDYVTLALQVPGITKAIAYGSNYTSVFVRIAANAESSAAITRTITGIRSNSGVATISTSSDIQVSPGQQVLIAGIDNSYTALNGQQTVGAKVWKTTNPLNLIYKTFIKNNQGILSATLSSGSSTFTVPSGSTILTLPLGTSIELGSEQMQVTNISGTTITVARPNTPVAHNVMTITRKASSVTSGVTTATLTTGTTNHGYAVGDVVTVSGVSGTAPSTVFNGTYTITAVTTTTFSYVTTGTAVTSANSTGSVSPTIIADPIATLTTSRSHGFTPGQLINVNVDDATSNPFNGTHVILNTPSATTLQFKVLSSVEAATTTNIDAAITSLSALVKGAPGFTIAGTYLDTEWTSAVLTATPYVKTTDPETQLLITSLESYLSDKKLIGSVVYGEGVEWTDADIKVSLNVLPLYNRASVQDAVKTAILDVFKYDNVDFGKRITAGDVYRSILSVDGVDYATITLLAEAGSYTSPVVGNINDPLIDADNAKRIPRINPLIDIVYPSGWITATGGLVHKVL